MFHKQKQVHINILLYELHKKKKKILTIKSHYLNEDVL